VKSSLLLACLLLLVPLQAHAYVDPGTGAYLVQALLALVGAGAFYLRHPRALIKRLWNKLMRRPDDK